MLNTKNNIFDNKNINLLVSDIVRTTQEAVEKYWEQPIKVTLLAINNFLEFRSEKFVSKVDFFSSKILVEKHRPVVIRLSKECIKTFFDSTLDVKPETFKLSELTGLEVRILNSFCEFLYKKLKDFLIPTQNVGLSANSDKYVNMLFLAQLDNSACFKFVLSVPLDRVKFSVLQKKVSFSDEDFFSSRATIRIRIGKTKVALDELENLSVDDIVLLEDSDTSKLTLISGNFEKVFNVKADPSLVLDLGGEDENLDEIDEVTMEKNLWDDIQIEVSAEFEKVKMTIGEIKQITQGQLVDVGSVFNNEISLFVENKKVAKGELIIINDRYAVKLNEVLSNKKPPQPQVQAQPKPQAQAHPQAQAQPRPQPQPQAQKAAPAPNQKAPAPPPRRPQPQQPQPQAQGQGQAPPRPRPPQPQEDENFDYSDFEK